MTEEAIELAYTFSKGVPRLINQICDNAFLTGYVAECRVIDDRIMKEVIVESPMEQFSQKKTREYA